MAEIPAWALTERLAITRIYQATATTEQEMYLIARRIVPGAFVVYFDDGNVLVNGLPVALDDEALRLIARIDAAGRDMAPDNVMPIGETYKTPNKEEDAWRS